MTPNVLRLVSRGKDYSGAMLPHLPKQWLRAPLTVEITCASDDDNATSLGDVDSFTLMFRELNADRLPGDDPEGIVWYSEETPIAENLGKTKGPHARFELTAEDIANITEAKDYWIAVHAVVGADRILRAAGIIAFADDGFPAEAPTPSDPGDYYLTKAQADTLYAPIGGGSGPGATDISITQNNASTVTVNSNTGSDGTIAGATTTVAGVMTAAQVQSLGIKANLTGAEFSGDVTVPNKIIIRDTASTYTINITGVSADDDLFFALPTSSGTLATQTYVTGITNGKVNKSGDTMTGLLTLPNITVTGSATFGTAPATSTISTLATEARTNQFPNAAGTFTVTGIAEGVPDKLGTYAKCAVAGGVTKGQVVYLNGADGANPTFALANASSEASSSKTYGFIDRACANNGFGVIITNGILDGLSLAAPYAEPGDSVWLSTVSGGIEVGIPPAKPAHSVYLGVATKVSNSGQIGATVQTIEVKVQNGYELGELHDVSSTTATANQALVWNSVTSLWTPTTLTISLVDGLQTALDGKAPTNNPVFTGGVTVPLLTGVSFVSNPPLVTGSLVSSSLTAARTWTLPDVSGTFVLQANTENGMSVGTVAGAPATVTDGQLWYDSTAGKFKFRQAGSTAELGTGGLPTAHAASHLSGGTDSIKLDDLGSPDDNTDLNATTLRHGLLPKLSGTATDFLAGDGVYRAPAKASRAANLSAVLIMGSDEVLTAFDPGGDRLVWWNDTTNQWEYLSLGTNLSISGGTLNAAGGTGSGSSMTVSDTPPTSPTAGSQWFDSSKGVTYVWYTDGTSGQWVATSNQAGSAGTPQIPTATTAVQGIARQATVAETLAGTVGTLMVSPLTAVMMAVSNGLRYLSLHEATLSASTGGSSISYQTANATAGGATITFPTTTGNIYRYVGGPSLLLGSGGSGGFDYTQTFMLSSRMQFNSLLDPGHVLYLSTGIGYGNGEAAGNWVDNRHGVGIRITDTNVFELVAQAGALATFVAVSSGITIAAGTTYDILVVSRNGSVGLYLNGVLVASTNAGPTSTSSAGGVRISAELTAATAGTKSFRCSGISIYNGI